jgi:GcrA cell cycle regulator
VKCGHWEMWPDDRVERLVELWNAGEMTASEIGAELGVSRNAVLGKVHRAGLGPSKRPKASRPVEVRKRRNFSKPRPSLIVDSSGRIVFLKREPTDRPQSSARQAKTSASYRAQLGSAPEMTVNQRRAFLTQAVLNTGGVR